MPARILVVDDSETVRTSLSRLLLEAGYEVFTESNPLFAAQAVVRHRPHLLILDVSMPLLGGQQVVQLVRNDRSTGRLRILFYSSQPEEQLRQLVKKSAADGYALKTAPVATLMAEVSAVLASR